MRHLLAAILGAVGLAAAGCGDAGDGSAIVIDPVAPPPPSEEATGAEPGAPPPPAAPEEAAATHLVTRVSYTAGGRIGTSNGIALLPGGGEVVSTADDVNGDVYVITMGEGYASRMVDGASSIVGLEGTSVAVDASGATHVAAYDVASGDLRYASDRSGAWEAVTLDAFQDAGANPILRVSPADDTKHIVYRVRTLEGEDGLARISDAGFGWTAETIVTGMSPLTSFAYSIGAGWGVSHLVYARANGDTHELVYGTQWGYTPWTFTTLPATGAPAELALATDDPMGYVYVVYRDAAGGGLYRVDNELGSWRNEALDAPGGRTPSLALEDGTGRLHLAWYDETAGDLLYARKDAGGAWVRFTLDAEGDVGRHAALAVETGGIHVAYQDLTNGTLKIARGAP